MPFATRKHSSIPFGCVFAALLALAVCVERLPAGGQLALTVVDSETGKPVPCRIHLTGPRKNVRKIPKSPFWHDHNAISGNVLLKLPNGNYEFLIERGLEYLWRKGHFTIENHADDSKRVELRRFVNMSADGWYSGDLDVRRPSDDIQLLMLADDLHVAEVITWKNDKILWGDKPPEEPLVRFDGDRCYHLLAGAITRSGTEVLLLNSPKPLDPPASRGEYPPLMKFLLHARESADVWIDADRPYWWDLPVLVATGQVDSIQVAGGNIRRNDTINHESGGKPRGRLRYPDPWGNARWGQHIYYQLLECGLRVPPTAGSGSGDSPNSVGYNRVYVHVDGEFSYKKWWEGLRAGLLAATGAEPFSGGADLRGTVLSFQLRRKSAPPENGSAPSLQEGPHAARRRTRQRALRIADPPGAARVRAGPERPGTHVAARAEAHRRHRSCGAAERRQEHAAVAHDACAARRWRRIRLRPRNRIWASRSCRAIGVWCSRICRACWKVRMRASVWATRSCGTSSAHVSFCTSSTFVRRKVLRRRPRPTPSFATSWRSTATCWPAVRKSSWAINSISPKRAKR